MWDHIQPLQLIVVADRMEPATGADGKETLARVVDIGEEGKKVKDKDGKESPQILVRSCPLSDKKAHGHFVVGGLVEEVESEEFENMD